MLCSLCLSLSAAPPPTRGFWLPVGDWQFWAATAVFGVALWWLFREVIPVPWLSKRLRRRRGERRATLTVGGRAVEKGGRGPEVPG
ncbi:MAG: hypothetical protein KF745_08910 [Phycisphaeraceae bacterium]|nr:hypothetical protein [Phycisphaeraceae bacterium]